MGTYEQSIVGELVSTGDPKILAQLKGMNEALDSSNKLEGKSLSAGALGRWYAPKIIATEETRESATFSTLTTKDEITSVVLPENGMMVVGYSANVLSSVASAGRAAIFLGANQLKKGGGPHEVQEVTISNTLNKIYSSPNGLTRPSSIEVTADVTTGQTLGENTAGEGGVCFIFAAAGTYNVSIQYKATSGNVKAKERKLWVGVIGT